MIKQTDLIAKGVFACTIDGSRNGFINELIVGVEGDLLCNFSSKIEIPEECIYIFFGSTNPVSIEAVFRGIVEFVGKYPIGTSRYVYRFIAKEILELEFSSVTKGNEWRFVKIPK